MSLFIVKGLTPGLGEPVSAEVALDVLRSGPGDVPELLSAASLMTRRNFGGKVTLCSIFNAKSGACTEDCSFCAQSSCHSTDINVYPLKDMNAMAAAYREASDLPVNHFGIVTSGATVDDTELETICATVAGENKKGLHWCASLGSLSPGQFKSLKAAGLKRFHHNLETAESFFDKICTTHSYASRLETVRNAKQAGLEVCCGGIFGLGESLEQRVEFALALQLEKVESIPMNFLVPVPGTALGDRDPMRPLDIIRSIVMMRMTNPAAEIKVCAGRVHLGDLQSMIFYAGATGMMIGNLLTVAGRAVEDDIRMLDALEVDYERREMD